MDSAGRWLGSVAAVPAGFFAKQVHRLATGHRAVVEVRVAPLDDASSRSAFLHRFRRIAVDDDISGVLLRIDGPPGGWAATFDLRAAIEALKASGKRVHAHLTHPGNAAIALASACDRVFVAPLEELGLVGIGTELTFFGSALERLGIEPDFEAAGAYKSFGEPFTRTFASAENQEAVGALVGDLNAQLITAIASGRRIPEERVAALLLEAPIPATRARDAGLVDEVLYPDEVEKWVLDHHGDGAHLVSFRAWAARDRGLQWIDRWGDGSPGVAVLHLDGPIVLDDHGPSVLIRARRVGPVLEAVRKDKRVAAVVLHVNSPGGSALASDLLWREVQRLAAEKPVIASFEDVSASGGYYLSAPAAEIVARPSTLTGSIGVFGGKLVVGEGLRKLGVFTQPVVAAPNATLFSPNHRFTEGQRVRFRASLQRFYDGFVERVAAGRHRPPDQIEPHCRGRVWTGQAALERGLIDRTGDLAVAVERARVRAGLTDYRVLTWSSRRHGLMARLLGGAVRRIRPIGAEVVEGILPSPSMAVVLRCPGEPLVLLPWSLTG